MIQRKAQGVLLYHPQVGTAVVQQRLAVIDHAPVHPGHDQGHADQQPQAHASEDELAPAVQDVAPGQGDHGAAWISRSTTRTRLRAVNGFSL